MSNAFDKLSVLDSFIEELNSCLPEIEIYLKRLAQSPDNMEALEESYRRAHLIGGSASMMDFPGLAHVAHGMEDILGDVLDRLTILDAPTIGLLQRSLSRLRRLLVGIRSGIDENAVIVEDDHDYVQYREHMETTVSSELLNKQDQREVNSVQGKVNESQIDFPPTIRLSPISPEPSLKDALASFGVQGQLPTISQPSTKPTRTIEVFFCYAHEDEVLLNTLKAHLTALVRQKLFNIWHDRNISAGTEWQKEIDKYLNVADIILLLVSPDFLASDYCYSVEIKRAMERHERGEAHVIPVILRPVYWEKAPFNKLQALPTDSKPVTRWKDRDEAFFDVAEGIRKVAEKLVL